MIEKKSLIYVLSALCLISIFAVPIKAESISEDPIPTYDSIDDIQDLSIWPHEFIVLNSDDEPSRTGPVHFIFEETRHKYSSFWGYHPSFSTWQYCDGYILSNSGLLFPTMSINIVLNTYISISVAKPSSSGSIIVNADNTRPSRPYVFGTVYYDVYRVEQYDDMNNLISTSYQYRWRKDLSTLGYGAKYQ